MTVIWLCVCIISERGFIYSELGKGVTSETETYLFRAANA